MGIATVLGSVVDKTIGIFSPQKALLNSKYRAATYAAAQSPRVIGDWSPVESSINNLISNSAVSVRARIRQLVRDFPYFARAINVMVDYTVGEGIIFQSAIRDKNNKRDRKAIQVAEDSFSFWCDEADVSGRLHYYEIMQLAERQRLECGEYFIIKREVKDRTRYLPLALQLYESDWLTIQGAQIAAGNKIQDGVEFDPLTGRAAAYHFTDPDGWGKPIRIDAASVIHGFRTLRPGQLRGISDFTAGVLLAKDLSTYMDAEMDAANMAAKVLGFVKTADMAGMQQGTTTGTNGQRIDTMENAMLQYLLPGEDFQLAANPRPGGNFPPMVKLILTMLSVATGAPYDLLSGDYSGLNYSTGKMVRNDFRHALRPISSRHIRGFCEPTKRAFFDVAVMAGKLPFRQYFTNAAPFLRCTWQPPGMESIDPARETKSMIDQVRSGLRSPQEITTARGRDLEDVYSEIKEAKDLAEEMGLALDLEAINTALANNPAAIEQQEAKPSGDKNNAAKE